VEAASGAARAPTATRASGVIRPCPWSRVRATSRDGSAT